jgi:hypothetical protein
MNVPLTLNNYYRFGDKKWPIGIELECEFEDGPGPEINNKLWVSKPEGSLRYHGMEYVNPNPITVEMKRKTIEMLLKLIGDRKVIKDSPRTSIHVHTNILRHTPIQIWTACVAYWTIENLLFKYCGEDREGNLFCLRLCDAEGVLDTVYKDLKGKLPFQMLAGDHVRYGGLNINAIKKFGSLEFRGMRGAVDLDVMDTWSTEVHNIVTNSKTYEHPEHLMDSYFKMDKRDFLKSLMSEGFVDQLTKLDKNWRDLVDNNVGLVMQLAYFHDWNKWQTKLEAYKSKAKDAVDVMYVDVPPPANAAPRRLRVNRDVAAVDPNVWARFERAQRLMIADEPVQAQPAPMWDVPEDEVID